MNKKIWWLVVGLIVIIILVVVLMTTGKKPVTQSSSNAPVTAVALRQSMHDLIASGAIQTCTFSIPATATTSSMSGTVYTASKNMRGDFVVTNTSGVVTNAHMIIASGTDYIWTDASAPRGVKLSWALAASSTALLNKAGGIDTDQPTTYSCTSWTPDVSKFAVPATMSFTDISRLVQMRGR